VLEMQLGVLVSISLLALGRIIMGMIMGTREVGTRPARVLRSQDWETWETESADALANEERHLIRGGDDSEVWLRYLRHRGCRPFFTHRTAYLRTFRYLPTYRPTYVRTYPTLPYLLCTDYRRSTVCTVQYSTVQYTHPPAANPNPALHNRADRAG
jgi:hypothetical protein